VHVPDIDHGLSSSRVLTMEFIDGARLTDPKALAALGVSRPGLARLVAETFNEMIFIHGDVHCDPHAANMVGAPQAHDGGGGAGAHGLGLGPEGRQQVAGSVPPKGPLGACVSGCA
jgi:predicted unusual protein kinase regulating ubiquinone biosynthesis (AarF/ABC1/UbiB family)